MSERRRACRRWRRVGPLTISVVLVLAGLLGWACPAQAGQANDWKTSLVQGCWACDTLNEVSDVGLGMAEQAFNALASETATLLGLFMGIWIIVFAGRMFLPFGLEGGAGALWNKGAKKIFQFSLVLGFLQGSQPFWDYVFIPVMSSGMAVASKIVLISDPFEAASGTSESVAGDTASQYCAAALESLSGLDGARSVMRQMNCPLAKIQSQFAKGMLVGVAIISGSVHNGGVATYVFQLVNDLVSGLTLLVAYFVGFMLFPLLLVDVVMRASVVTVISPLAIAATLFGPTRRIAEKALWHLVQSGLTLVFAAVVGGIAKAALAYTFGHLKTANGVPLQDWKTLVDALEYPGDSQVSIDLTTSTFYALLGVAVILLFMLRRASHMASEFSGASAGDFSGAGSGVATMAGAAAYAAGSTAQLAARYVTGGGSGRGKSMSKAVTGQGED